MPLSSTKKGWAAAGILILLASAGAGFYLRFSRRSASQPAAGPGGLLFAPSAEQSKETIGVLAELPDDAPAVAFIDVAALRILKNSPLPALLGLTGTKSPEDLDYRQFVRDTGFDYTRDLDRVAAAFWLDERSESSQRSSQNGHRVFIVADGRFDQARIQTYARKSGAVRAQGIKSIYEIRGEPAVSLEFLTPSRIAIASGTHATELLSRPPAERRDPSLQARIGRAAGAPLFAVARADRLPRNFYASFHDSPQIESVAKSLLSLTLAAQPRGKLLKVVLEGESTSAQNALAIATLAEIARMGASVTLADPKTSRHLTTQQDAFLNALVREAIVSRQDRWVRLSFDVTPQMLGSGEPTSAGSERAKPLP